MSLEWAERVRALRKSLDLTQMEFAELLDITDSQVSQWERAALSPTLCMQRIFQFINDCTSNALSFLSKKPWQETEVEWGDRIEVVLKALNWSQEQLATFMGVTENAVNRWKVYGHQIDICNRILISLVEVYSDVDRKEWPPGLYFEPEDIITPERIKLLRQSLALTQRQLASFLHMTGGSAVCQWESGEQSIGWCANLLLRIVETFPRAADLLHNIPWDDEELSAGRIRQIRMSLGLTMLELSHFLGSTSAVISYYEKNGLKGRKELGCPKLVWLVLEKYPEEFISFVEGLSNPGGQACPVW